MGAVNFSDIITFTRASGGGRFNAQGVYEWLPADQPRFDFDPVTGEARGLLIEEQRTNLLTYSSDFANGAWTKAAATITSNASSSPSGLVDASKVIETTTSGQHELLRLISVAANSAHSCSIYMKKGERKYGYCGIYSANGRNVIVVDLDTGEITQNNYTGAESFRAADVTYVGDGWYRLTVVLTTSATSIYPVFGPSATGNPAQINGRPSYQGDGASGIYIWGAQLEAGSFPTSHIPTLGAQVTRAADVASVNELSPWFNASEGTLFVEFLRPSGAKIGTFGTASGLIGYTANSLADRLLLMCRADGAFDVQARTAGTFGIVTSKPTTAALGSTIKGALAFKRGDYAMTVNGQVPAVQDTDVATPPVSSLRIGNVDGGNYVNGHIRVIKYLPKRVSNSELQAMTQV